MQLKGMYVYPLVLTWWCVCMMQLVFPTEGDIFNHTCYRGKINTLSRRQVAVGLNCTLRPRTNAINNIQPYWDHTHI